jgi:hypothetical protein
MRIYDAIKAGTIYFIPPFVFIPALIVDIFMAASDIKAFITV